MTAQMQKWTRPDSYAGPEYPEYYVLLTQHRDSDTLTRSNFQVALKRLGGESETVLVIRDHHWAVGWIEFLYIHELDAKAVALGHEMTEDIAQYPSLDETHWSELEYTEAYEYWDNMSLRERIQWCADHNESIFAARPGQQIPDGVYEAITSN